MVKDILRFAAVVALSVVLATAIFVYSSMPITFGGEEYAFEDGLPLNTELTAAQVEADREQMIKTLESVHPYFINEADLSAYNTSKSVFIGETQDAMTVDKLQLAVSKYLVSLNDGHTHLYFSEEKKLDINWLYYDGKCRVYLDDVLSDEYVTAIGGVAYEDICKRCDEMFPAENRSGHELNYQSRIRGMSFLKTAGVAEADYITVTLSDGTEIYAPVAATSGGYTEPHNTCETLDGDIFYVDFNTCENNAELADIAAKLKTAVDGGLTKVIIDARGNGGGSSNACEALLNAIGMQSPDGSMLTRYSAFTSAQRGYLRSSGSSLSEGGYAGKQNPDIQLIVLTDRSTFSSAMMLGWWVKDGKLGTIIGSQPSNNPCQYGDNIEFQLENSRLCGSISHKLFARYDKTKLDDDTLYPDVELKPYADALEFACDYLKG